MNIIICAINSHILLQTSSLNKFHNDVLKHIILDTAMSAAGEVLGFRSNLRPSWGHVGPAGPVE